MAAGNGDEDRGRKDDAARAAWLYYVGGMRQDRIAEELGISRQGAQRLVARAAQEGMIRVRIEHPIAACQQLGRDLSRRYGLEMVRIAPSLRGSGDALKAITPVAAGYLESFLASSEPQVVGLGTGRTLKAVADEMQALDGSAHKLVSLIGNVAPDGSASFYEVVMRFADRTKAAHYPMSVPVMARDDDELALYQSLPHVRSARELAKTADTVIVGIGQIEDDAPLFVDGFITSEELSSLRAAGAAGEICGHVFNEEGQYLDHPVNRMMVGVRVPVTQGRTLCIAGGASKIKPLRGALTGGLLSGLITDEDTAAALLAG